MSRHFIYGANEPIMACSTRMTERLWEWLNANKHELEKLIRSEDYFINADSGPYGRIELDKIQAENNIKTHQARKNEKKIKRRERLEERNAIYGEATN